MAIQGPLKLNVQILRGDQPAIGPGKALVLEAIDRHGSISAAGRELGMSYRRIWLLVSALNRDWREPVVDTHVGEGPKSGARLSSFGRELLTRYREMEGAMVAAAQGSAFDWLVAMSRPASETGSSGDVDG
jgi:molybdate transport system regulatory protein